MLNSSSYKWLSLNLFEINCIKDKEEKECFLRLRKNCIKALILPLLINLPLHTGFKFSNVNDRLSCKDMLQELFSEYHKRSYTKDEVIDISMGKRVKKR